MANTAEKKIPIKLALSGLLVFLFIAVTSAIVLYSLYNYQDQGNIERLKARDRQILDMGVQTIINDLASIKADLSYLTENTATKECLDHGGASCAVLATSYANFVLNKKFYDQISLINTKGMEVVRVNLAVGKSYIVPKAELQDKSKHSYFMETIKKPRASVYVSPLDLNIEKGEVERPIKPVIRFSTPIDDNFDRKGMLTMNFLGRHILYKLNMLPVRTLQSIWLVNENGYWLQGPSVEDEWGFALSNKKDRNIAIQFPVAWNRMQEKANIGQLQLDDGLFSYVKISPSIAVDAEGIFEPEYSLPQLSKNQWYLIVHRPQSALGIVSKEYRTNFMIIYIIALIFFGTATAGVVRSLAQRNHAREELELSESRFRTLLASAPDAIVLSNTQGDIVYVNFQAEKLFGYSDAELIGQKIEMLIPERFRKHHTGHRKGYVQIPQIRLMGEGQDMQLVALRKDGNEVPVAISLSPIRTQEGLLIFNDIRDISLQKSAEHKIQELNEILSKKNTELQNYNQELEAFSYSISHDLRAPLRGIDGFSQALLEDYQSDLPQEANNYLVRIRSSAQRMGLLIDDLLRLSKITRTDLTREAVDITAITNEIVDALQQREPKTQLTYEIQNDLNLFADKQLVYIALENLIDNAWKFTQKTSQAIIKVGRLTGDNQNVFYVQDNGVGFDTKYADKLFGAFQRLHDQNEFPGTGIGLAIVKRVILKHGGTIWAESILGYGATFYFTLNQ